MSSVSVEKTSAGGTNCARGSRNDEARAVISSKDLLSSAHVLGRTWSVVAEAFVAASVVVRPGKKQDVPQGQQGAVRGASLLQRHPPSGLPLSHRAQTFTDSHNLPLRVANLTILKKSKISDIFGF